jgi:SAM-dependent methyltransferase
MSNEGDTQSKIRDLVSHAYTKAIERVQGGGGCCGGAPAGAAAQHAGYAEELQTHKDAGASSFGCGNPLAFAEVGEGESVLDLGSGAGFDLLIAAAKVGPRGRVIGVDMTDAIIDAARKNIEGAGLGNVEVRKGHIEKLPVEDDSVDWVISNCVINLSPEKEKVFAEINRVLKPGGRISISDIVVEELPGWLREHQAAYAACVAGAISEPSYIAGLERAGLDDVGVSERVVYTADQIRGMVESDLQGLGLDPDTLGKSFKELEGKVWSARFSGRKS